MIDIDRRRVLRSVLGWAFTVGGIVTAALSWAGVAAGYLVLRPFTHPLLPLVCAPTMLAVGAGLLIGHRLVRVYLQWTLGLAAAIGACIAVIYMVFASDPVEHSVVATSKEFRLVAYYWPDGYEMVVRLQSRQGLASREGAQDVACFMLPRPDGEGPRWYLERAEFTGDNGILLRAKDGQEWLIGFDPSDLSIGDSIDMVPYGSSRSDCTSAGT